MEFLGVTLDVLGKILISYTALAVHFRFWQEHKIDEKVVAEMKHEQRLGLLGIAFIIIGYSLQIPTLIDRF